MRSTELYDRAPFGYLTLDRRGEVVTSNLEATSLLGTVRSQLVGGAITDFIHPDDRSRLGDRLALIEGGSRRHCEVRVAPTSAPEEGALPRWVRFELHHAEHEGDRSQVLAFLWDVTDRRLAEEAVKYERDKLISILEAMEDGVTISNMDHDLEYVNPALVRVFGPYEGRKCHEYLRDRERACPECVAQMPSTRWQWRAEVGRTYDLVSTLLSNPDGTRSRVVIYRDITRLAAANDLLRADAERKDRFLAVLSHELRTPLTPLLHAAQLIRTAPDREVAEEATGIIENQVKHMARLIEDLLDVSRIASGKVELRRERIELMLVVNSVRQNQRQRLEAAGLALSVRHPDASLCVDADAVRLAQILSNLLDNAVKYTDPGGRIEVVVGKEGRRAAVRVRDSGRGIPSKMLPHIFEMFTQGGDTGGGLGLGLALARQLAELHGGTLTGWSAGPGLGSEFVLEVPLARPVRADFETGTPGPREVGPASGLRVLVVDDNVDSATALGMILEVMGHEVQIAFDGTSALDTFQSFAPRAAILDIGMPDMSGLDLAAAIRRRDAGRDVLLIALSGWGQQADRRRALASGFDHHMVKPAELDELQRLLGGIA